MHESLSRPQLSWVKMENYNSVFWKLDRSRGVNMYQDSFILDRLTGIEIFSFKFS